MVLLVEVGTFVCETVGGNGTTQVITTGFDPKAYIFSGMTEHVVDERLVRTDCEVSLGFSDGTNEICLTTGDDDNRSSAVGSRRTTAGRCIVIGDVLGGQINVIREGHISASSSTSFTITWDDMDIKATRINYVIFGGVLLDAEVGNFDKSTATAPTNQDVPTGVDVRGITNGKGVLFLISGANLTLGSNTLDCIACFGCATSDDGDEWFNHWSQDDNQANLRPANYSANDNVIGLTDGNVTIVCEATLNAWLDDGTNGFQLRWTTNDSNAYKIGYLIMKGELFEAGTSQARISTTGTTAYTTTIEPQVLLTVSTNNLTMPKDPTGQDTFNVIGFATSSTVRGASGYGAERASDPGFLRLYGTIVHLIEIYSDPNALLDHAQADLDSFNEFDFTLDWEVVDATNDYFFHWFVAATGPSRKEFTIDARLTGTLQKLFTLDARLVVRKTKTFIMDSQLKGTLQKIFQTDAILKGAQTKTFLLSSILKATFTKTFLADAQLVTKPIKSFLADAILQATQTKTFLADALLKAVFTKTFSLDAQLKGTVTKTFLADARLKASIAKTFLLDAALKAIFTKVFSIDAALSKTNTKTMTIDAALQVKQTKSFSMDAILIFQDFELLPGIVEVTMTSEKTEGILLIPYKK